MGEYLLISDAAKQVKVESHVLRYWEEELHLPIKRNELGHRYYTKEDVERFKEIKSITVESNQNDIKGWEAGCTAGGNDRKRSSCRTAYGN